MFVGGAFGSSASRQRGFASLLLSAVAAILAVIFKKPSKPSQSCLLIRVLGSTTSLLAVLPLLPALGDPRP